MSFSPSRLVDDIKTYIMVPMETGQLFTFVIARNVFNILPIPPDIDPSLHGQHLLSVQAKLQESFLRS